MWHKRAYWKDRLLDKNVLEHFGKYFDHIKNYSSLTSIFVMWVNWLFISQGRKLQTLLATNA